MAAYKDEMVKCFFAEYLHPFIKVSLFAIQSLYDSWCLPNILGIICANGNSLKNCNARDRSYVEDYHQNTSKVLLAIGQKS